MDNQALTSRVIDHCRINFIDGLTLIELLTVLVICSISLTIAAPSLNNLLIRNRVTAQVSALGMIITSARAAAIYKNTVVTLCRSNNQSQCSGKWHQGIILFTDSNKDHILNNDDQLILATNPFPKGDKLYWRAFQNKQYLQMTPRGYTRYQNGTFTYCPKEGLKYARAIILNAAGRLRYSKDNDKDGINEGADGKPLRC